MAGYTNMIANPWLLHLQKLDLELKCPLCLKLLTRPSLLPCDHVFCGSCIPRSQADSDCPVCKSKYETKDMRDVPFLENIISIYKGLNTAVSVNLCRAQSTDDDFICKNDAHNTCGSQKDSRARDFEVLNKSMTKRIGSCTHDSPPQSSQESNPRPKHKNITVEINQAEQLLLESPPLLDDAKSSDNEVLGTYAEQASKRVLDTSGAEATETHLKESKRQKKLMFEAADNEFKANCNVTSSDQPIINLTAPDSIPQSTSKTICGFCQSSETSEAFGEMQHYCKGRQVVGDDIFHSNVIHVHRACLEWAPQVYYEADKVKNLKPELERGMKIKCTKCNQKGAALGCYVKSCRRSYHVPCALQTSNCRWDHDNFLLLCPAHSSVKFPNEKSRARVSESQLSSEIASMVNKPTVMRKLVLCGSALSLAEKTQMEKLAMKHNATISKYWSPNVTHVIASTKDNGACTRTLKVLMGILHGRWILNTDWVRASLEASCPIDEEPYEIRLDTQGCRDGPRTARLRAASTATKLFDNLRFYFYGDFVRGYKEDLQNLVRVGGGEILRREEELAGEDGVSRFVVYNIDPPLGCALGEEVSIIWERASQAEVLASRTKARLIGHTWLLESIAAYKLQPLLA